VLVADRQPEAPRTGNDDRTRHTAAEPLLDTVAIACGVHEPAGVIVDEGRSACGAVQARLSAARRKVDGVVGGD
jgi:hypothetical protein